MQDYHCSKINLAEVKQNVRCNVHTNVKQTQAFQAIKQLRFLYYAAIHLPSRQQQHSYYSCELKKLTFCKLCHHGILQQKEPLTQQTVFSLLT